MRDQYRWFGKADDGKRTEDSMVYEPNYRADEFAEIRRSIGLSQQQLANELGTDQTTISRCERGFMQPTVEQMVRLSELTGTSVQTLIDRVFPVVRHESAEVA